MERYVDQAAIEAHRATEHFKTLGRKMGEFMEGRAEVTRLTPDMFEQRTHTVLRTEPGWPGRRLHTLNHAGSLECIDGAAYAPRSRFLARRLETWSGRREPS